MKADISYAAVEEDYIGGLVIDVFDDSDKDDTEVALLHGCPQSCMPNPVEGLLEVYVFIDFKKPTTSVWH